MATAVLCSAGAGLTLWFTDTAYGKPPLRAAAAAVNQAWQEGAPVLHTSDGSMLPFLIYAPDLPNTLLDGDPERAGRTARARSTYEALVSYRCPSKRPWATQRSSSWSSRWTTA